MGDKQITIQDRLRQRIHNRHDTLYKAQYGADGSEWGYDAELDGRAADEIDRLTTELESKHQAVIALADSNIKTETQLTAARAEAERLRAIVDKLPMTADGVRVIGGMGGDFVYHPNYKGWGFKPEGLSPDDGVTHEAWSTSRPADEGSKPGVFVPVYECYSTPEAALAAQRKESDDG